MNSAQKPTATKLLLATKELLSRLNTIYDCVKQHRNNNLRVSFHHNADKMLAATYWSDQYYSREESSTSVFIYEYEVTSRGISFTRYEERDPSLSRWQRAKFYWSTGPEEPNIRLTAIPNAPPPNFKGTMYTFHQERIREALSILPAWAHCVIPD